MAIGRLVPLPRFQDERIHRACRRLIDALSSAEVEVVDFKSPDLPLVIDINPSVSQGPDGFCLDIGVDRIELVGGANSGCFAGLAMLRQLLCSLKSAVPPCHIEDWPDYQTRALLFDVTRGKVPTLDTLENLVDRLAGWRVNQLQLNIEHAFCFSFDPDICSGSNGLTVDEVRALDEYCRDRFIDLVPAVATLGHMGRILSMPKYRHLAEIEPSVSWEDMEWPERMRGLTLNCLDPAAQRLIEQMLGDIMDAFSSPILNACGDEPHDLGKGKNADRLTGDAQGRAYVDHLRHIHGICTARDRRVMFWGDVLKNHEKIIHHLPDGVTLLHWGYDDSSDYEMTKRLVTQGFETMVCPGTSGWKRILNAMDLAERNIDTFARVGVQAGAKGMLNTDWGDHGHFNMLASSWHGIACGACKAWRADHPIGAEFDRRLGTRMWGHHAVSLFPLLRTASRHATEKETWRLFWQPLATVRDELSFISADEIEALRGASDRASEMLGTIGQGLPAAISGAANRVDVMELQLACRFLGLFADKVELATLSRKSGSVAPAPRLDVRRWSEELSEATQAFTDCWHMRNKRSGLDDILKAISRTHDDMIASAAS